MIQKTTALLLALLASISQPTQTATIDTFDFDDDDIVSNESMRSPLDTYGTIAGYCALGAAVSAAATYALASKATMKRQQMAAETQDFKKMFDDMGARLAAFQAMHHEEKDEMSNRLHQMKDRVDQVIGQIEHLQSQLIELQNSRLNFANLSPMSPYYSPIDTGSIINKSFSDGTHSIPKTSQLQMQESDDEK